MRIKDTEYAIAPIDNPTIYPGKIPDFSFLFLGKNFHELVLIPGTRVGHAHIIWSDDKPENAYGNRESLNNRLVRMGATSVEFRYPIVAFGSNASPSQLERKYLQHGISSVIPVIRGRISGVEIVYSSHISSYGSIPATAITCDGAKSDIHVTFIDEMQLQILDQSEPNYYRMQVDSRELALQLESGEILSKYYIYVSKHGYLGFDDQTYRLSAIKASNTKSQPATQLDVITKLIDWWNRESQENKFESVDEFIKLVRDDAVLKDRLNSWISKRMRRSELTITASTDFAPNYYRDIKPIWPDKERDEFIIEPNFQRSPGEYAVAINQTIAKSHRLGRWVCIEHTMHNYSFSVIAERLRESQVVDPGIILMDQTLRNSLGAEIGDRVKVQKLEPHRKINQRLMDLLIPRNYLMMRTQSADILMIEKPQCAMAEIAMEILGIEDGDVVVFESFICDENSGKNEIKKLRLRAYRIPESTKQLRGSTQSGLFLETRFPDCSEVLGVFPDLPWVFVDEDARKTLGIRPCSPVRVRASRWYQIIKEFRNFSLLIIVTLLGAISIFETEPFIIGGILRISSSIAILTLGIVLIAFLIFFALRKRLSPKIRR